MATDYWAFGEFLWDVFPTERHAGGAPFNVAAHLAQLEASVSLISAVGQDPLGDEILSLAAHKGVNTASVSRARPGLATGTVKVTLDLHANATYEIVEPVAWDEISVTAAALTDIAQGRALLFGSLAARSAHNRKELDQLLEIVGPMRLFDVNLRPPFVNPRLVIELARSADVLKLNDELGQLAGWVNSAEMSHVKPADVREMVDACTVLPKATGVPRICITRGADGAVLW